MQKHSFQQEEGKKGVAVSTRDFTSCSEHKARHCSEDLAHKWSLECILKMPLGKRQLQHLDN